MRQFQFYEFVGIVVPGSVFLVGLSLVSARPLPDVFLPKSGGDLGLHALLAYAAGHLVQAVGNVLENVYWRLHRGMPTDWPFRDKNGGAWPGAYATVVRLADLNLVYRETLAWRRAVATVRNLYYVSGHAERLETFNGNYGLCRGIVAALLSIAVVGSVNETLTVRNYVLLAAAAVLSCYRMDRFGRHYASELFAWAATQDKGREPHGSG